MSDQGEDNIALYARGHGQSAPLISLERDDTVVAAVTSANKIFVFTRYGRAYKVEPFYGEATEIKAR